jgi:hypothetical protein
MPTFLYQCPITGYRVQGSLPSDDAVDDNPDAYRPLPCIVCGRTHLVNPKTGMVAGQRADRPS